MKLFNKQKEKEYCIFQIKQNYNFNENAEWTQKGQPYCQLIAYGKSKKDLKNFADIAWDLCNIFCWEENMYQTMSSTYEEPITRDNEDYVYPIAANFEGIVNSDIIICEKNKPEQFYAADTFGWAVFNSKELAEEYILTHNVLIKKNYKYEKTNDAKAI